MTHRALLIGIDHYLGHSSPGGVSYGRLNGCVRDVNRVSSFLTNRVKVDPRNITKLTATNGDDGPLESESVWPTYSNMVNAFKTLAETAHEHDQIYIHYSGHGGRATTMFPNLKGATAFDEGLVPLDIGKPGDANARYLRDIELHSLLQAIVDKQVRLTVVFDCCHSGGTTRGVASARPRGIARPDLSPPPPDSAVGPVADLIARWQADGSSVSTTRGARDAPRQTDWLFEPRGYTLVTACRANELANENIFDGEVAGVLTHWLVDTLGQSGPNTTWKQVLDRVAAKVHGEFASQTPLLQGEGEYKIFGAEMLDSRYTVSVLAVDAQARRVRLNAGEAHGLTRGAQFAIYPSGADLDDEDAREALVELAEIESVESWADMVQPTSELTVEVGSRAVMLPTSTMRVRRAVRVAIDDAALCQEVEAAVEREGGGFLVVAGPAGAVDFIIDLHPTNPHQFVIRDSGNDPVPHLNPPIDVSEGGAMTLLVKRLVHLAQFRNTLALDLPDPGAMAMLDVELTGTQVKRPGEKYTIKMTNLREPNPHDTNDATRVLNISVLLLASDWSVAQIYPSGSAPFQEVDPGQTVQIPELQTYLSPGSKHERDVFKVFATRSTTDFRVLELPPLDEPLTRSGSRGAIGDALQLLLDGVTGETRTTRGSRPVVAAKKDRGWTVRQVEVIVSEDGTDPAHSEPLGAVVDDKRRQG